MDGTMYDLLLLLKFQSEYQENGPVWLIPRHKYGIALAQNLPTLMLLTFQISGQMIL